MTITIGQKLWRISGALVARSYLSPPRGGFSAPLRQLQMAAPTGRDFTPTLTIFARKIIQDDSPYKTEGPRADQRIAQLLKTRGGAAAPAAPQRSEISDDEDERWRALDKTIQ